MEKELLQLLADQAGCIFLSDLHDPEKIELLADILPALPAELLIPGNYPVKHIRKG